MLWRQRCNSAAVQAEALGLGDAVIAAKAAVQARRARLMADIHAANAAGSLADLGRLQEAAVQLGLADAHRAMREALEGRAHAAEIKLQAAARTADKREFDACVQVMLSAFILQECENGGSELFGGGQPQRACVVLTAASADRR